MTKVLEHVLDPEPYETPYDWQRYRDRCDSCGVAALWRFTRNGRDLMFCGHHVRKQQDSLVTSGWAVERAPYDA